MVYAATASSGSCSFLQPAASSFSQYPQGEANITVSPFPYENSEVRGNDLLGVIKEPCPSSGSWEEPKMIAWKHNIKGD